VTLQNTIPVYRRTYDKLPARFLNFLCCKIGVQRAQITRQIVLKKQTAHFPGVF